MHSGKRCWLVFVIFASFAGSMGSEIAARADDLATAQNAFQAGVNFGFSDAFPYVLFCAPIITAPPGKRLVVQYASAYVELPPGHTVRRVQLKTSLSSAPPVYHNLVLNTTNRVGELIFGQEVKIYADSTVDVCVQCLANSVGTVNVYGSVSGYFTP
jgi:hypothetical protein